MSDQEPELFVWVVEGYSSTEKAWTAISVQSTFEKAIARRAVEEADGFYTSYACTPFTLDQVHS